MYVYVISRPNGLLKIGMSGNVKERKMYLQSNIGEKLSLLHEVKVHPEKARLIEGYAHNLLVDKKVVGEWFNASLDEAVSAINEAVLNAREPAPRFRMNLTGSSRHNDVHSLLKEDIATRFGGSQASWANWCGVTRAMVNAVLKGKRNPSKRMLDVLGLEEAGRLYRIKGKGGNESR